MPEIISRKEAIERGLRRYFTGKPCKWDHVCERYTSGLDCIDCLEDRKAKEKADPEFKEKSRKRHRVYYHNNAAKRSAYYRELRRKYPEKFAAYQRRSQDRMRKMFDLVAVLRKEMPDLLEEFGL